MWRHRLQKVLAVRFELLALQPDSPERFRGRYLRLGRELLGLGTLVSQGAEATVYELIDLRRAARIGVAKICRFLPGSDEYLAWAVPVRFELNPSSSQPDIEMYPASLVRVDGGFIKLQDWISKDPRIDWSMKTPAEPIWTTYQASGAEAGLAAARKLLEQHGPHGILLETQGAILSRLGQWEEARDALEAAFKAHAVESRTGLLRTGLLLAEAHRRIYESNKWTGSSATMSLAVPDGPTLHQVIYSDAESAGLEDTLEDRALYVLLEILEQEPCFVPALFMVAEEMASSQASIDAALQVLDAIERIDPEAEEAREYKRRVLDNQKRYFEHLASIAVPASESAGDETPEKDAEDKHEVPKPPIEMPAYAKAFDDAYAPESQVTQVAEARYASVWANLGAGRTRQAEEAARAAISLDPENVLYPLALAEVLRTTDRIGEAEQLLQEVTRRFPDRPEGFMVLGEHHIGQNEAAKARLDFLRAGGLTMDNRWRIDLGLGHAYRLLGDRAKALSHLRRAYAAAPDARESETRPRRLTWRVWVAMQLAYALRQGEPADSAVEHNEALLVLNDALASSPDEPDLLFCRAQSLAMLGRIEEAILDLERVMLVPGHESAGEFLQALRNYLQRPDDSQ